MPIIQPDLSEAADLSPISEGTYPGKIKEAVPEISKEKKTPMIRLKVGVQVDGKERTRRAYIMTAGPGASGFDQLLRAVHMDELADKYKDPEVTNKPAFDTDTLVDQDVNVIIVPELFQQKGPDGNPIGSPEVRDRIKGFAKA